VRHNPGRDRAVQMIDVHLPTTDGRELLLTRYTDSSGGLFIAS
jgi:hypothetical protein